MFKKIIAILLLLFPFSSQATSIFLDPASGTFGPGDTFGVSVRIDLDNGECINAAEAKISFPKNLIQVEDFSTGDSFLTLWIEKPDKSQMDKVNQDGILSFSGGTPGGYCGKVPGDPGDSNAIGQIFFKVPQGLRVSADEKGEVVFSQDTKVLLNDGLGTPAKLSIVNGEFTITAKAGEGKAEWADKIKGDNVQPDPFVVELSKDSAIFEGKYFIMFSTTDKQTGVDHYEVMEIKLADLAKENQKRTWLDLILKKNFKQEWVKASSPYMLIDQSLDSLIKVKAIDKAGNERVVEFTPSASEQQLTEAAKSKGNLNIYVVAGILLIVLVMLVILIKKINGKRNKL